MSHPGRSTSRSGPSRELEQLLIPEPVSTHHHRWPGWRWTKPLALAAALVAAHQLVPAAATALATARPGNTSIEQARAVTGPVWAQISPLLLPAAGVLTVLAVLTLVADLLLVARRNRQAQVRNATARALRLQPPLLRVVRARHRRLVAGPISKITLAYDHAPGLIVDADAADKITEAVSPYMGHLTVDWLARRNRIVIRVLQAPGVDIPRLEEAHPKTVGAVHTLGAFLVPGWTTDQTRTEVSADGEIRRLVATYGVTSKDSSDSFRRRFDDLMMAKCPSPTGAWDIRWFPADARVEIEPVKPLPKTVPHPGVKMLPLKTWEVAYGVSPTGATATFDFKRVPHLLDVGTTGTGKSVLLRSIVTSACASGWEVVIADPKVLTFRGFAHWPGVRAIATTGEDMERLIIALRDRMNERYAAIAAGHIREADLRPMMLVIDELTEWIIEVNQHAEQSSAGARGRIRKSPAVAALWQLLRKARQAGIQVVVATQRPDVSFIPGEARDNAGNRAGAGHLKADAAEMLFGTRQIPQRVFDVIQTSDGRLRRQLVPGRMTVSQGGEDLQTAQAWWTPDPAEHTDTASREILDRLRQEAQQARTRLDAVPDPFAAARAKLEAGDRGLLDGVPTTLDDTPSTAALSAPGLDDLDDVQVGDLEDYDADDVVPIRAHRLAPGDRAKLPIEDGAGAEDDWVDITDVTEDDVDDDRVLLTFRTAAGAVSEISMDGREVVFVRADPDEDGHDHAVSA